MAISPCRTDFIVYLHRFLVGRTVTRFRSWQQLDDRLSPRCRYSSRLRQTAIAATPRPSRMATPGSGIANPVPLNSAVPTRTEFSAPTVTCGAALNAKIRPPPPGSSLRKEGQNPHPVPQTPGCKAVWRARRSPRCGSPHACQLRRGFRGRTTPAGDPEIHRLNAYRKGRGRGERKTEQRRRPYPSGRSYR
jgi:hypothetical protein